MNLIQHLKDRHFDTEKHTFWANPSEGVVTFPMWNLSGSLRGYQQYRPSGDKKKFNNPREGRYYTYRSKFNPEKNKTSEIAVWGLETFYWTPTLFVLEGIFDACHLTKFGQSAIATASNDLDKQTMSWLWCIRQSRYVVTICDGDKAGKRLARFGTESHIMPDDMDLGDASDQYVKDLIRKYDENRLTFGSK